jgi:hypothetical protein
LLGLIRPSRGMLWGCSRWSQCCEFHCIGDFGSVKTSFRRGSSISRNRENVLWNELEFNR